MNFPQFWARGRTGDFIAWRWSSQSQADAQSLADQAAQQLSARCRAGERLPQHGGYYPDRPFREQVLQEIKDHSGEPTAVITRNSYGCLVLNTARAMFVDIDLPEPKPTGGFLRKLFGKPDLTPKTDHQSAALTRIENWTRQNPDWGWRIYRTRSGLRLLATQDLFDANSDLVNRVFDALGTDPLYRQLCNTQKCFRARLTPKPWRCGHHDKPDRWPWLSEKMEKRFQKWEAQYTESSTNWATCEFLRALGNPSVHPQIQAIVKLHDEPTRATSKLPLA